MLLRQMGFQILCHAEGLDLLLAKDGGHLGIRGEPLLVGGILQVVGLQVGPQTFNNLGSGQLLVLLGADNGGQLGGQGHGFGQTIKLLCLCHV